MARTASDVAGFDALQRLQHVFALGLRVDRKTPLQFLDGFVRADADVKIAVIRRRFQKTDVAAMEHVEATADKNFFRAHTETIIAKGIFADNVNFYRA